MYKKLSLIVVIFMTTMLTACGWHFKNAEVLPKSLQTLAFVTHNSYGEMSRALRNELLLNNIKLVSEQKGITTLYLNSISKTSRVASVFKDAREAEKILSVKVSANIRIPNKGVYPIDVVVHRTFFDDSRAALAKAAEQDAMLAEMYSQASSQIIIKMIVLDRALSQNK